MNERTSILVNFVMFDIGFFLITLALIVFCQLVTGKINLTGLVYDEAATSTFSPGRVQLLVITVTTASYYLMTVLHHPARFPAIPQELLLLSGGGNIVYLIGKSRSLQKKTRV